MTTVSNLIGLLEKMYCNWPVTKFLDSLYEFNNKGCESMKTKKTLSSNLMSALILISTVISTMAFASYANAVAAVPAIHNDFGVVAGIRSNSADYTANGYSGSSKNGLALGVIGFFEIGQMFQLRSGFIYSQHNYILSAAGLADVEYNMSYVDIPLTATYRFSEYAGAFAGPVVGLLATKECKTSGSTCTTGNNPDAMTLGAQIGATFKFAPQMGAEIYYEVVPSGFWKNNLTNSKAVGINFLVTFE